jgi:hypothetical protein
MALEMSSSRAAASLRTTAAILSPASLLVSAVSSRRMRSASSSSTPKLSIDFMLISKMEAALANTSLDSIRCRAFDREFAR